MVAGTKRQLSANRVSESEKELHKGYGKVPRYLQKFKQVKEEEKKQKEIDKENAKIPAGCRLMGEEERLVMLDDLKKTAKDLESQIMKMPLTMKTMAIQKRKQDLEDQLDKVNKNIALFSRQTVYVGI